MPFDRSVYCAVLLSRPRIDDQLERSRRPRLSAHYTTREEALTILAAPDGAGVDVVVLEGAEGLLAPITWEWTIVDFARELGAAALVVASDRLGTINHTLLTVGALEFAGIEILGIALTSPPARGASTGTKAMAIPWLPGMRRLVEVPRLSDPAEATPYLQVVIGWLSPAAAAR